MEVAERIIQRLDDPSIFRRYCAIKSRVMVGDKPPADLTDHIKSISLENRKLTLQIEELSGELESTDSLELYAFRKVDSIRASILPRAKIPAVSNFEEACDSLLNILAAKEKSHRMHREKTVGENTTLRGKLNDIKIASERELDNLQKRRLAADHEYREWRAQFKGEIEGTKAAKERLIQSEKDISNENASLIKVINAKETPSHRAVKSLKRVELRHAETEQRLLGLQKTLAKDTLELKRRINEIDRNRTTQRFGIVDPSPEQIKALRKAEDDLAALLEENKTLSSTLKKMKLALMGSEKPIQLASRL